jgi:hypothetical protein
LAVTANRSSKLPCEGDAAVARIDAVVRGRSDKFVADCGREVDAKGNGPVVNAATQRDSLTGLDVLYPAYCADETHVSNLVAACIGAVPGHWGAYLLSRNLLSSRRISMYNHTSVTNNPKAEYHSM